MAESGAAALNVENKMGEPVASGATLEVSVSFGRFESDSLSWEKWSSFSPNKYMEEVEKLSAPGSVAQKKAYFEAHYKKIAARKAEQLGQEEKQIEINHLMTNDRNGEEPHYENACGTDTEVNIVIDQSSAKEFEQGNYPNDVLNSSHLDESNENGLSSVECQNSLVDGAKDEFDSMLDNLVLGRLEESVPIHEGTCINRPQDRVKLPLIMVKEDTNMNGAQEMGQLRTGFVETRSRLEIKKNKTNMDASKFSQKIIPTRKEGNLAGTKKKPSSPLPKRSPQVSTPKTAKTRSTNISAGEIKKTVPSTLHMSLNLSPANSESTLPITTRKSLIMEKMGDKDIVKRAFKTFQNNFNHIRSSGYEISSRKEVPIVRPEQKVSTSLTPPKENQGLRNEPEKIDSQRCQLGRSRNSPLARSLKGASMDQRNTKPAPSSLGLLSDGRARKQRASSNKLEEKSYAREVEKTRLHSKPKEEKLRQPQFKATLMPGFYRGHMISNNLLDKEVTKNKHPGRPEMQM